MKSSTAKASAHPNIALIKYWGNSDDALRLPANDSLSITLGALTTTTTVTYDAALKSDQFTLNHVVQTDPDTARVSAHLDLIRHLAHEQRRAHVESVNSFPAGAGIASSASGFAALTVAACAAAGLTLDSTALSRLARRGSGSAARSMLGGFVQLHAGSDDALCFAEQLADIHHWPLRDLIVVSDRSHKLTGSTGGHHSAPSSPLQAARVSDAARRIRVCREAIQERDFHKLAAIAELDSNLMHAIMFTSTPPLLYWNATTIHAMQAVTDLRSKGYEVLYTVDAGPNVHCICSPSDEETVLKVLQNLPGVKDVLQSGVGGPPRVL